MLCCESVNCSNNTCLPRSVNLLEIRSKRWTFENLQQSISVGSNKSLKGNLLKDVENRGMFCLNDHANKKKCSKLCRKELPWLKTVQCDFFCFGAFDRNLSIAPLLTFLANQASVRDGSRREQPIVIDRVLVLVHWNECFVAVRNDSPRLSCPLLKRCQMWLEVFLWSVLKGPT